MRYPYQQPPVQQVPPIAPPQQPYAQQQTAEQPVVPVYVDCPVPLDSGYRRVAGLYFRESWQMLLGVLCILAIVFIAVRIATRGYLWGLVFVLAAALAAELPALRYVPACIADKLSGQMLVRTVHLSGVTEQPPSLMSRIGLSAKARYALVDDRNRRYLFTAAKGLQQGFTDLEGAEVEIAFLAASQVMTGIHPVRRTEYLSVMESARERHLRQVFKDYLP